MPHSLDLILTIAGGLAAALVGGYFTHRLRLSPIVGYLLAGILVGPNTPGFVADRAMAEQLAEIGVVLLMFGVGLQFHVEELLAVRRIAIPGAIVQIACATALGAWAAHAWGWSLSSGLVFGVALSVASTVVLVRVLSDHKELHTETGHIAIGWLVVEDVFTVLVLVLMPAVFGGESASPGVAVALAAVKAPKPPTRSSRSPSLRSRSTLCYSARFRGSNAGASTGLDERRRRPIVWRFRTRRPRARWSSATGRMAGRSSGCSARIASSRRSSR